MSTLELFARTCLILVRDVCDSAPLQGPGVVAVDVDHGAHHGRPGLVLVDPGLLVGGPTDPRRGGHRDASEIGFIKGLVIFLKATNFYSNNSKFLPVNDIIHSILSRHCDHSG